MRHYFNKFSSFQLIIIGFGSLILAGTLLLMLPWATKAGESTSFLDAFFTSTSAVCVTGLVIHDTATHWTICGQAIILLLIQFGGIGVIMAIVGLSMIRRKQIGLKQRNLMQDSISAPSMGGIIRLFLFVIKGFLLFEGIGAILLFFCFRRSFPESKSIWYSLFHAISAFCNAGFDLMGINNPFSSLTLFSDNLILNITIMLLIVIGGIGFTSWRDLADNKLHVRKYRLQTKMILSSTTLLILLPALLFFFFEYPNATLKERTLASLFQSVTTRTAGFNTMDLTSLSDRGQAIMTILMLIGGSPGSTAGGMKTTTITILLVTTWSVLRKSSDTIVFGRRIKTEQVRSAWALFFVYIFLFLLGGLLISALEGIPLSTCLFESASAIGTVGLTLGITPSLGSVSRIILIFLMFLGRVGGMTLFYAFIPAEHTGGKYPVETVAVG